jgi:hypothetical protein
MTHEPSDAKTIQSRYSHSNESIHKTYDSSKNISYKVLMQFDSHKENWFGVINSIGMIRMISQFTSKC